jgi:hypothetical protein
MDSMLSRAGQAARRMVAKANAKIALSLEKTRSVLGTFAPGR